MFGIIYGLFSLSMNAIGGIYNGIQNNKSKKNTYDPRTGTYIDHYGCTRDYLTDEYRNPTGKWNKEKNRYENIIIGPGNKIVRNLTEEEEQKEYANDWKVRADYEHKHKLPKRGEHAIAPVEIYKDFYKPKNCDDIIMLTHFWVHRANQDPQKIDVWFMPYKFKVYKIEIPNVNDITIEMLNDTIHNDEIGLNGINAKTANNSYYIHGGHVWLCKREKDQFELAEERRKREEEKKRKKEEEKEQREFDTIIRRLW